MNRFYEDVDIPPMDFRPRNRANTRDWNMRITFANPGGFYPHQDPRITERHFGGPSGNRYHFPTTPPINNFQPYNFYRYDRDNRYYNQVQGQGNVPVPDVRVPLDNRTSEQKLQQSHRFFCKNYERGTVNPKQQGVFFHHKKGLPKEIPQKSQETEKKEALAAELRKSLRKFQKNHSQNSNHLLTLDKSKDTNRSSSTLQPQPCFPWDLPLTVDDLKTIGRGKTGNIEASADSCSENELSSLEKHNYFHNPEIGTKSTADTLPEIMFVKQCRKRQISESIDVERKKRKLDYQSRRRHRSASPNLCEGKNPEDAGGNSQQTYRENFVSRESKDDSVLPSIPNVESSPKSVPTPSLMQLLGVKRREFNEMVDQPRNPRVQFMLSLLMKRHKELLLQRAIRSRFSALSSKVRPNIGARRRATNQAIAQTKELTSTSLQGMGASDTIDQLSNILLESSLTVDISSLPQELIDQLGTFLEMGVDFGNDELLATDELNLNSDEQNNDLNNEVNHNDNLNGILCVKSEGKETISMTTPLAEENLPTPIGTGKDENISTLDQFFPCQIKVETEETTHMPETNFSSQITVKEARVDEDDDIRIEWDRCENGECMVSAVNPRHSPEKRSRLVNEKRLDNLIPLVSRIEKESNDTMKEGRNCTPTPSVLRSEDRPNDTSYTKEKGRNYFTVGNESNVQSEKSHGDIEGVNRDHPNSSPPNSTREDTEEKILALMWEIDQKIGSLMEEKQKLYESLKRIRSEKSKSADPKPISSSPQESSHVSSPLKNKNSKALHVKATRAPRNVTPLQNPQSFSSRIVHHSNIDIGKECVNSSVKKCDHTKSAKVTVQCSEIHSCASDKNKDTTQVNPSIETHMSNVSNKSDEPIEILFDSNEIQEAVTKEGLEFTGHKDTILALKLFAKFLYASCADFCVHCYNIKTRKLVRKFQGHSKTITCLYIHSSDKFIDLYSGSHDQSLLKFNSKTGKILKRTSIDEPIQCMTEGWGTLFIGTKAGTVERFCIAKGVIVKPAMSSLKSEIMAIEASKEGPRKVLIIATRSKPIIVRDAHSGLLLRAINDDTPRHIVFTISVHRGLVYAGTSVYGLTAWDFTSGKCMKRYENCGTIVSMEIIHGKIYAASYDGNIYVYETGNSKPKHIIKASDKMLLSLAVRDNKVYTSSLDKKLKVWGVPK